MALSLVETEPPLNCIISCFYRSSLRLTSRFSWL